MVVFPFVTKPAKRACSSATLYTHQALVSTSWMVKLQSSPSLGVIHSRLICRACQALGLVYTLETWRTRCSKYKYGKGKHVPARISQYIQFFLMPLLPPFLPRSLLSTSKTLCLQQNWTYIHTVCPTVSWSPLSPFQRTTFNFYNSDHATSSAVWFLLHNGFIRLHTCFL